MLALRDRIHVLAFRGNNDRNIRQNLQWESRRSIMKKYSIAEQDENRIKQSERD